jgi:hypothetical protein
MYLRKNTPEEILESIRLRMIYSSSKTLNENLKVIKEQASDENQEILKLLRTGAVGPGGFGTDENSLILAIDKIRDVNHYKQIESEISKNPRNFLNYNSIESILKGELESGNTNIIKDIQGKLKGKGIDLTYDLKPGKDGALGWFEPSSIKVNLGNTIPVNPGNSRQQNINNLYCSLSNNRITLGVNKGKRWDKYVEYYKVTPEEIEVAKSSCTKKGYTPPKPKYTYCKSFPFKQKCKNRLIIEVQSCLGLPKNHQTGNFGPITLKSLNERLKSLGKAETSEITEDVYRIIIQNCNGSSDIEPSKRTTKPVQLDGPKRPSTSIGYDLPTTINAGPKLSAPNVSGEQLFKAYLDLKDLYKRGDDWVFKGDNMTRDNLDKVSQYLRDQGYRTLEKGDKPYGEKFVWKR